MIHLKIDGECVEVEEGTTILEAARKLNVHIPTLCYHEDQAVKAVCRICVVEVEGQRLLPTACNTPVSEGMVVKTASPKVIKARKNVMELILARHPQDCLICSNISYQPFLTSFRLQMQPADRNQEILYQTLV